MLGDPLGPVEIKAPVAFPGEKSVGQWFSKGVSPGNLLVMQVLGFFPNPLNQKL